MMKKIIIFSVLFTLLTNLQALSFDFEVDGVGYNIISFENLTVEATKGTNSPVGTLVIPDNVTYNGRQLKVIQVAENGFSSSSQLTNLVIGNNVESIGDNAFYYCNLLESINGGNSLKVIGKRAFYYCALKKVTIHPSVMLISDGAFAYNNTEEVYIEDSDSLLTCGNAEISGKLIGMFYYDNVEKAYIGRPVAHINQTPHPLYHVTTLKEITYGPQCNMNLKTGIHQDCVNLVKVTLGENIKTIGTSCFSNCTKLSEIKIPDNVTEIGNYAFKGCSALKYVSFGKGLVNIDESSFALCDSIIEINSYPQNPPTITSTTFDNKVYIDAKLNVLKASLDSYKNADYWKNFWTIQGDLPSSDFIVCTNVSFEKENYSMFAGQTKSLNVIFSPENATNKSLKWSSSDNNIATVDENGTVTGLNAGNATISIETLDGSNLKASCSLKVNDGSKAKFDLDGDGQITVSDATCVINAILDN